MAKLYDAVDLFWDGSNGDFAIGTNGDLASTEFDPLQAIAQELYSRVKADRGDWLEAPLIGATLSEFVGERNTRDTGAAIKKRILSAMATHGTISASDLSVDVVPISKDSVAVVLQLRVMPTVTNKNSRVLKKVFIYSYLENNIHARG
jgi:hypothetical protein